MGFSHHLVDTVITTSIFQQETTPSAKPSSEAPEDLEVDDTPANIVFPVINEQLQAMQDLLASGVIRT